MKAGNYAVVVTLQILNGGMAATYSGYFTYELRKDMSRHLVNLEVVDAVWEAFRNDPQVGSTYGILERVKASRPNVLFLSIELD